LRDRKISLELTEEAVDHVVRVGYDPSFGARPLKRAIQKEIENPLARLIVAGEVGDGDTIIADFDQASARIRFETRSPVTEQ
jgi:ATP-dependent Clp protease ATP-binding subunit ClpB